MGLRGGGPHGPGRVVVTEPLRRLPVPERHPDPDRDGRGKIVPTLGTLDHPRPVGTLRDLGMMVLHRRLLHVPLRGRTIATIGAERNPYFSPGAAGNGLRGAALEA